MSELQVEPAETATAHKQQEFTCPSCGEKFQARQRSTFFGFQRVQCTLCGASIGLGLTPGMRVLYWVLVALSAIAALASVFVGYWYVPGVVSIIAIVALLVDMVRRSAALGNTPDGDGTRRAQVRRSTITIVTLGSVMLAATLLVTIALETAVQHTVVDKPEQPETFRVEQVPTGEFRVTRTEEAVCQIGQDWFGCIDALVDQFNANCANIPLDLFSEAICNRYSNMLDELYSREAYAGWTVTSLGDGWKALRREPTMISEEVSNNDYEPAVTHEATCYLGFLGECPE